jgi:heme A synthase
MSWMMYKNYKNQDMRIFHWAFGVLILELYTGIFLNLLNMHALIQTLHLLLACILFGMLGLLILRIKTDKQQ